MSIAKKGALSYKGYIDKLKISPRLPTFLRLWSTWLSAALATMSPLDVSTSAASPLTTISWSQDPSVCQSFMPWCSAPVTVRYDKYFLFYHSLCIFIKTIEAYQRVKSPLRLLQVLFLSILMPPLSGSAEPVFICREWPPPLLLHLRGAGPVSGLVPGRGCGGRGSIIQ